MQPLVDPCTSHLQQKQGTKPVTQASVHCACAALERLRTSHCDDFTDTGIAALAPLSRLSSLHLSFVFDVVGIGCVHLTGLSRLRNLKLDAVQVIS